jgi:hypothetical protein
MVLFIAYPSVSVKILRLFRCREVEGTYYLVADMRLECFTPEWWGYGIYGIVMVAVYVVGLPALILSVLYKNKATLFGPHSEDTMSRYDRQRPRGLSWDPIAAVFGLCAQAVWDDNAVRTCC